MLDQASKASDIRAALKANKYVLSNRYITSSQAHQTSRFGSHEEREKFLQWIDKAGYQTLNMPREDIVLVLYVPTEISLQLAREKSAKGRKDYSTVREIAEENSEHQKRSADMYLELCDRFDHWHLIDCSDCPDKILTNKSKTALIIKKLESLQAIPEQQ
jgi:dTMP kinase